VGEQASHCAPGLDTEAVIEQAAYAGDRQIVKPCQLRHAGKRIRKLALEFVPDSGRSTSRLELGNRFFNPLFDDSGMLLLPPVTRFLILLRNALHDPGHIDGGHTSYLGWCILAISTARLIATGVIRVPPRPSKMRLIIVIILQALNWSVICQTGLKQTGFGRDSGLNLLGFWNLGPQTPGRCPLLTFPGYQRRQHQRPPRGEGRQADRLDMQNLPTQRRRQIMPT